MRFFGICCGRKNGNTELLMAEALNGVKDCIPDAECSFVNLQEAEIKSCIGCETCMKHKLQGDLEFRCIHGINEDHFYAIEQQMRAADGIIVSAPAYNLLPPGILIRFLNKMHASGDYRAATQGVDICKVGGCFSIGGTDWTDYMENVMRMITMELVGVYDGVADAVHFDFLPGFQLVLASPEVLARVRELGRNVAEAALRKKETGKNPEYKGDWGVCPYCHSNMIRVYEDGHVTCPQCNVEGAVSVENGKIRVIFTEEAMQKSRWAPYGQRLHMENIGKGHKRTADNAEMIKESFTGKYRDEVKGYRLTLPELDK